MMIFPSKCAVVCGEYNKTSLSEQILVPVSNVSFVIVFSLAGEKRQGNDKNLACSKIICVCFKIILLYGIN